MTLSKEIIEKLADAYYILDDNISKEDYMKFIEQHLCPYLSIPMENPKEGLKALQIFNR